MNKIIEKELSEKLETLLKRVNEVSSNDGLVSMKFNGAGDYLDFKINLDLDETNKESLEKAIVECLNNQKRQTSFDLMKLITETAKREENNNDSSDDKDDFEVTIKNVS